MKVEAQRYLLRAERAKIVFDLEIQMIDSENCESEPKLIERLLLLYTIFLNLKFIVRKYMFYDF